MQISISTRDGSPIYSQITAQIKRLVAVGRLQAGDELPAIRVLAEQLLVNPNTVARAYRELESEGVVEKRRTAGTYISAQGSVLSKKEKIRLLSERVDQLLIEAIQMDVTLDEVQKIIEQRHSKIQSAR